MGRQGGQGFLQRFSMGRSVPLLHVEKRWAGMLGQGNPPGRICEKEEGAGPTPNLDLWAAFTTCRLSKAGKEGLIKPTLS